MVLFYLEDSDYESPTRFQLLSKKGITRKITPDISRANFLSKESKKSLRGLKNRVEKLGIDEFSANSIIKDIHDIIIQTIRSKILMQGFSSSGNYAHEAEVAFMKKLGFSEYKISFVNNLRSSRNGINYYEKSLKVNTPKSVIVS